jgi:hypothetical protein
MNWRRGLLLAWAMGSVAWIAVVIVMYNAIQKILDPMVAYKDDFPFAEARAKGMSDDQIAAFLSKHAVFDYGRLAVLPPAIVLVTMVAVWWAVRALKRSPSN